MKYILLLMITLCFSIANASDFEISDSGLKYIILEEGKGKKPSKDDTVWVHYKGEIESGYVFAKTTNPERFELTKVIKGWTEGIQYMKTGSVYKFIIPPHLAYGKSGIKNLVGPNDNMIFTIQLISIE